MGNPIIIALGRETWEQEVIALYNWLQPPCTFSSIIRYTSYMTIIFITGTSHLKWNILSQILTLPWPSCTVTGNFHSASVDKTAKWMRFLYWAPCSSGRWGLCCQGAVLQQDAPGPLLRQKSVRSSQVGKATHSSVIKGNTYQNKRGQGRHTNSTASFISKILDIC